MSPTLSDVKIDSLYSLFKGEPGTRKSTCALSYPGPQYWFSYDMKMEALKLPMKQWGIDPRTIHYDDYTDWSKGLSQLEKLQINCKYKTIVVDSITSLGDAINRSTLKTKQGKGEGKVIAGIPVNSIEDFNAEDSALKEMVAITKDINAYHGANIIIIAHIIQKETKSADGKTHMSRIILTAGKGIAQKIPSKCGEVYHFNIETGFDPTQGGQYGLLTTHTGDDFARTSLQLPDKIIFGTDPLYSKWISPGIERMREADKDVIRQFPTQTQSTTSKSDFTIE